MERKYIIEQDFSEIKGPEVIVKSIKETEGKEYLNNGQITDFDFIFEMRSRTFLGDFIENGHYLIVSDKLKKIIKDKDVLFYPLKVYLYILDQKDVVINEKLYNNYFLMQPKTDQILDIEKSDIKWVVKNKIISKINKMEVYSLKFENNKLLRMEEKKSIVIVTESLKHTISENDIQGIKFISTEEYRPWP